MSAGVRSPLAEGRVQWREDEWNSGRRTAHALTRGEEETADYFQTAPSAVTGWNIQREENRMKQRSQAATLIFDADGSLPSDHMEKHLRIASDIPSAL